MECASRPSASEVRAWRPSAAASSDARSRTSGAWEGKGTRVGAADVGLPLTTPPHLAALPLTTPFSRGPALRPSPPLTSPLRPSLHRPLYAPQPAAPAPPTRQPPLAPRPLAQPTALLRRLARRPPLNRALGGRRWCAPRRPPRPPHAPRACRPSLHALTGCRGCSAGGGSGGGGGAQRG